MHIARVSVCEEAGARAERGDCSRVGITWVRDLSSGERTKDRINRRETEGEKGNESRENESFFLSPLPHPLIKCGLKGFRTKSTEQASTTGPSRSS